MAAGDLRIVVNETKLKADFSGWSDGIDAVSKTLTNTGRGQVLTSARKKLAHESGRALHGRGIANILADRGHDVFLYDLPVADMVEEFVADEVSDAMDDAFDTARPQVHRIRTVLRAAAAELADSAKANISRGGLGDKRVLRSKRSAWTNYWTWQAKRGRADLRFGNPPPYGYRTGRFYNGIRGFWTLGRSI